MQCPKCDGMGCYNCDRTGTIDRFITETKESWRSLQDYLETEPYREYRLVTVVKNEVSGYYDLIWEFQQPIVKILTHEN
jgi:hypothetical protein